MEYKLTAPLSKADAAKLRAGDTVLLSGTIYTARDAAHKRLCALAAEGKPLRKVLAWAWAALICLSTVFTKQHSVIDVACGLAVAFVWLPVVYRPARALH